MAKMLALALLIGVAAGVAGRLVEKPGVGGAPGFQRQALKPIRIAVEKDALPAAANTTVTDANSTERRILPDVEPPAPSRSALDSGHPGYEPLKEKFANEPVDKQWASRVEAEVNQQLAGFGSEHGFEFVEARIHCRTTICRLDLVATSNPVSDPQQQSLSTAVARGLASPLFASDDRLNRMKGSSSSGGQAVFFLYQSDLFGERPYWEREGSAPAVPTASFEELQGLSPEQITDRVRANFPGAIVR